MTINLHRDQWIDFADDEVLHWMDSEPVMISVCNYLLIVIYHHDSNPRCLDLLSNILTVYISCRSSWLVSLRLASVSTDTMHNLKTIRKQYNTCVRTDIYPLQAQAQRTGCTRELGSWGLVRHECTLPLRQSAGSIVTKYPQKSVNSDSPLASAQEGRITASTFLKSQSQQSNDAIH